MSDLLEQLRKAVGDSNVVAGDAVHADYTHDETLGATPQTAAGPGPARFDR